MCGACSKYIFQMGSLPAVDEFKHRCSTARGEGGRSRLYKTEIPLESLLPLVSKQSEMAHKGISLVQMVVALTIVAIMATLFFPRALLQKMQPDQLDTAVQQIQTLMQTAATQAMLTGTLHRVFFSMDDKRTASVEMYSGVSASGALQFTRVDSAAAQVVSIPADIEIVHFVIKGIDEAGEGGLVHHSLGEGGLKTAWLYVEGTGITQDIRITLRNKATQHRATLTLTPFTTAFVVTDE